MFNITPILKKNINVSARSYTLPLAAGVVNAVLLILGLSGAFSIVMGMENGTMAEYAAFLKIYALTAFTAYFMLLVTAPALSAGSISSERQLRTLDLLLVTKLRPVEIVAGNCLSILIFMAVIIASCFPMLLLPVMYGGVGVLETVGLMFYFVFEALFLLSAGFFASSAGSSPLKCIITAYALIFALIFGTGVISFVSGLVMPEGSNPAAFLLSFNPLLGVLWTVFGQIGEPQAAVDFLRLLHFYPGSFYMKHLVAANVLCQTALGIVFMLLSVYNIAPARNRRGYGKITIEKQGNV